MKFALWTGHPSHHQAGFFNALRARGHDLVVRYIGAVSKTRLAEGWQSPEALPDGESYISGDPAAELERLPDWRERIHVVSGYAKPFLRELAVLLSNSQANWVHWSEDSTPGWRWWATLPRKRWYGQLVNRFALGAFGFGQRAMNDFRRWGIYQEKIAYICYSVPPCDENAVPDEACVSFKRGRLAFLYLGSMYHGKGCDVLLSAFRQLEGNPPPVLLMVGADRSGGTYARSATEYGIADRTLFRGPVSAPMISSILKAADVLVLPSRYDGWGVVLNEAASMRMPIIASNQCGSGIHLVESGRNGFRVEAGSVRSLAAAMQCYVSAPELCRVHGDRSYQLFESVTPQANADRFCSTVETWMTAKKGLSAKAR